MYCLFVIWKKSKSGRYFMCFFTYFVQYSYYTYCWIEYNAPISIFLYSFMSVIYLYKLFYLHWSLTNILHSFVMHCICCMEIAYLFSSMTDRLWNINCAQNMLERYPALVLLSQPWQFSVWVFHEGDKYNPVDVGLFDVVADVPLVVKRTSYILVRLIVWHTNTVTVDVLWIFLHLIKNDVTVQLIRRNSFHYQTA